MEEKAQEKCGIVYPCAACRIQRRKCGEKCPLAPYFPPDDPHKFSLVNRLFGTSKIVRILQDIPVLKRGDAVKSMVYEASVRKKDPFYGCTGAICVLQKQLSDLQTQLARTQAELMNAQANISSLTSGLYNGGQRGNAQNLEVEHNEDIIVLQNDLNLFGLEDMIFPC